MKTILSALFISVFFVSNGCKDKGTSPISTDDIDSKILGAWYYFEPRLVVGYGDSSLHGINIVREKRVEPLGIETATGKLAVLDGGITQKIIVAKDGVLIVEFFCPPDNCIDTLVYRVEGSKLIIQRGSVVNTYQRAQLGIILTTPVRSTLSVTIDSLEVRNPRVATSLPTFVRRSNLPSLELHSAILNGWLSISVNGFNGIGTYPIGANQGILTIVYGDVIFNLTTDSLSSGTISIDTLDDVTGRCAGRFMFDARTRWIPSSVRRLRNGVFSVPVFWVSR